MAKEEVNNWTNQVICPKCLGRWAWESNKPIKDFVCPSCRKREEENEDN